MCYMKNTVHRFHYRPGYAFDLTDATEDGPPPLKILEEKTVPYDWGGLLGPSQKGKRKYILLEEGVFAETTCGYKKVGLKWEEIS